jgi:uncharacterized protein
MVLRDNLDINYLILILTSRCNLKCLYCYNGYLAPEDMDLGVLKSALAKVREGHGALRLQLTGGEPTMVPHLIDQTVTLAKSLPRPCRISIQTNGTLLDRSQILYFKENNIEVGLSLDGPPLLNDQLRGRSQELFRSMALLDEAQVPFTVTTVVTQANALELYKVPLILAQYKAARGLGLDLLINKGRGLVKAAVKGDLISGLEKLKLTLKRLNQSRPQPLVLREEQFLARAKNSKNPFCEACRGGSMAVTPKGDVYPCGQTAFREGFYLGNLKDNLKESLLPRQSLTGPHCRNCALLGRCPGECPSRLYFNEAQDPHLVCSIYRTLG